MRADPDLHERFERAGADVRVDTQRRLEDVQRAGTRRGRVRKIQAFAVAAAVGLLAVGIAWQLRFSEGRAPVPGATVEPAGRLAYLRSPDDVELGVRDLLVLDAASGRREPIHEGGAVLSAAWSPDGSRLAFIVQEEGSGYTIVVSEPDGSEPVTIVDVESTGAVGPDLTNLAWSPDGSKIAYSGRTLEAGIANRTIFIVNADGSGRPTVLDGHWEWVSWAPDGRQLLLTGFPQAEADAASLDLYALEVDGSGLMQLTDDRSIEHSPSWSPDGTRIVFSDGASDRQDIYVMSADGSDVRRLTDRPGWDFVPVWSADGAWIAFVSDRGATPAQQQANRLGGAVSGFAIYAMHPDGSDVRLLIDDVGSLLYPVSWAR